MHRRLRVSSRCDTVGSAILPAMTTRSILTLILVATAASAAVLVSVTSAPLRGMVGDMPLSTPSQVSDEFRVRTSKTCTCQCERGVYAEIFEGKLCVQKPLEPDFLCDMVLDLGVLTQEECARVERSNCFGFYKKEDGTFDGIYGLTVNCGLAYSGISPLPDGAIE
jgi:hypothetical protein